jgi:hypothetical protein
MPANPKGLETNFLAGSRCRATEFHNGSQKRAKCELDPPLGVASLTLLRNCKALYELVKVEAGPETVSRQITRRECGGPFPARQGKFVLKYFMLRKAVARKRKSKRASPGISSTLC